MTVEETIKSNKGKYSSIELFYGLEEEAGKYDLPYKPDQGYGSVKEGRENELNSTAMTMECIASRIDNGVLEIEISSKVNIFTGEYPN